jgi:hypothetical protein
MPMAASFPKANVHPLPSQQPAVGSFRGERPPSVRSSVPFVRAKRGHRGWRSRSAFVVGTRTRPRRVRAARRRDELPFSPGDLRMSVRATMATGLI